MYTVRKADTAAARTGASASDAPAAKPSRRYGTAVACQTGPHATARGRILTIAFVLPLDSTPNSPFCTPELTLAAVVMGAPNGGYLKSGCDKPLW